MRDRAERRPTTCRECGAQTTGVWYGDGTEAVVAMDPHVAPCGAICSVGQPQSALPGPQYPHGLHPLLHYHQRCRVCGAMVREALDYAQENLAAIELAWKRALPGEKPGA